MVFKLKHVLKNGASDIKKLHLYYRLCWTTEDMRHKHAPKDSHTHKQDLKTGSPKISNHQYHITSCILIINYF